MESEWLTIQGAAEYLKAKPSTIRKYMRLKKLPYYKLNKIIRLKKADLDCFLKPV